MLILFVVNDIINDINNIINDIIMNSTNIINDVDKLCHKPDSLLV